MQPFEGMTGAETVAFIEEGNRLQRPEKAEVDAYQERNFREILQVHAICQSSQST